MAVGMRDSIPAEYNFLTSFFLTFWLSLISPRSNKQLIVMHSTSVLYLLMLTADFVSIFGFEALEVDLSFRNQIWQINFQLPDCFLNLHLQSTLHILSCMSLIEILETPPDVVVIMKRNFIKYVPHKADRRQKTKGILIYLVKAETPLARRR